MFRFLLLLPGSFLGFCFVQASDWETDESASTSFFREPVEFAKRVVRRTGDASFFGARSINVVWFEKGKAAFRIIDNGAEETARYQSLSSAMRENGCVAGSNGGFFLENFEPSGLMICDGQSVGTWGTANLLSGALVTTIDGKTALMRCGEFRGDARQLIQAGPFLVDGGVPVRGLSDANSRRRTFALYDGKRLFALGMSDSFTLKELAEILAMPGLFPGKSVQRALNLDGGTSSGFYFDRGQNYMSVHIEPLKRVRNFVGIVPKS